MRYQAPVHVVRAPIVPVVAAVKVWSNAGSGSIIDVHDGHHSVNRGLRETGVCNQIHRSGLVVGEAGNVVFLMPGNVVAVVVALRPWSGVPIQRQVVCSHARLGGGCAALELCGSGTEGGAV